MDFHGIGNRVKNLKQNLNTIYVAVVIQRTNLSVMVHMQKLILMEKKLHPENLMPNKPRLWMVPHYN